MDLTRSTASEGLVKPGSAATWALRESMHGRAMVFPIADKTSMRFELRGFLRRRVDDVHENADLYAVNHPAARGERSPTARVVDGRKVSRTTHPHAAPSSRIFRSRSWTPSNCAISSR